MVHPHSTEEHAAAFVVAALAKRGREDEPDAPNNGPHKIVRYHHGHGHGNSHGPPPDSTPFGPPRSSVAPAPAVAAEEGTSRAMRPHPFFFYRDFSTIADPDPLVPLTSPGRVPNFPAKMHSILSRSDIADIVAWMPHGRGWRVLKPREFEIRVIPTYFEHAKFSSFIRQANGWGFRRVTQGRDRNSYYHDMFLRGLPHLCKMMKRPGVSEKQAADPEHEPDLYKISEGRPVPERAEDESILLHCTMQGGPKARMPIYHGIISSRNSNMAGSSLFGAMGGAVPQVQQQQQQVTQYSTASVAQQESFHIHSALPHVENQNQNSGNYYGLMPTPNTLPQHHQPQQQHHMQQQHHQQSHHVHSQNTFIPSSAPLFPAHGPNHCIPSAAPISPTITAAESSTSPVPMANPLAMMAQPNVAAAFQGNSAAAQFAAGFAAAAALSNPNLRDILGQALASFPVTVTTNTNGGCTGPSQSSAPQPPPSTPQQQIYVSQHSALQQHHHALPQAAADAVAIQQQYAVQHSSKQARAQAF